MSDRHPYTRFEGTPLWRALERALDDLVTNRDLVETTRREYIVGYLCQEVVAAGVRLSPGR